jgi:predicted aldo/keto reductase-like oxidoreductase
MGNDDIEEKEARRLIEYAYEGGINYFDTAYRYHNGQSESFVGNVLRQYPRETWYLATKMPGHMMSYQNGRYQFTGPLADRPSLSPPAIFEQQLEKCGVDYFDFYLLHNVNESSYNFYTSEEIGVIKYLLDQKKAGRIGYFGFSTHGRSEIIEKFLTWSEQKFAGCFDFVQIQLNYLDWTLQEADRKYEIITRRGLPIFVMEPCRGGRLASLGATGDGMLKKAQPGDSVASWAFRFLQSLPNIQVVLSGMSTMDQLRENIGTFSKNDPLSPEEKKLLQEASKPLLDIVPCTACRYCCEGCPKNLDIPRLISLYNEAKQDKVFSLSGSVLKYNIGVMDKKELPAVCIGCGACSKICPQGIDIPYIMKKFAEILLR